MVISPVIVDALPNGELFATLRTNEPSLELFPAVLLDTVIPLAGKPETDAVTGILVIPA